MRVLPERSRRVELPHDVLVSVAIDRLALLVARLDSDAPLRAGGTPSDWAAAAGLDQDPLPVLGLHAQPTDPYPAEDVARLALRRLVDRAVMEWAGPDRWRPVLRMRR